jgi:hypothetical protein
MIRPRMIIPVAMGLAFAAGIAVAQTQPQLEINAANDAIEIAITHLQRAGQGRITDPGLETRRARAMAYLLLAKTEIQPTQGLRPLN